MTWLNHNGTFFNLDKICSIGKRNDETAYVIYEHEGERRFSKIDYEDFKIDIEKAICSGNLFYKGHQ